MITPEESVALNEAIAAICDDDALPVVIGLGGKRIPYIGWYWREVDFTQPVSFGRCRSEPSLTEQIAGIKVFEPPRPSWGGFMENNKWDYPRVDDHRSPDGGTGGSLRAATTDPTQRNLQSVYDFIQASMSDEVRSWDGRTGWDKFLVKA